MERSEVQVRFDVEPEGLRWPASSISVRVQPLRLTVQRSPILRSLLATLAAADRCGPLVSPFLMLPPPLPTYLLANAHSAWASKPPPTAFARYVNSPGGPYEML